MATGQKRVVFVLCLCVCLVSQTCAAACKHDVGLTDLQELVIGRCHDYQTEVNPAAFCETGLRNCADLWEKFSSPFLHQDPCHATADAFDSFIEQANMKASDKMLFWSGTYSIVHAYSYRGQRYTTLEDTLIGYMIDGLSFCGDTTTTDGFGHSCPRRNEVTCPSPHWNSFWTAASTNFAQQASGEAYVLMNATRVPIYKDPSFFREVEVPNMNSSRVTKLTIILINDSPSIIRSPCTRDTSIKALKQHIQPIDVDCLENPSDLLHLYCVDQSSADVCQSMGGVSGATGPRPWGLSALIVLSCLCLVDLISRTVI